MKTKRLEILEESLRKKEARFNEKLQAHYDSVRATNGQPLNDKRNGAATLRVWERQNDALRKLSQEIERSKEAIERERWKIKGVEKVREDLPDEILGLIETGVLVQWRKYPNTFFVNGVDKAHIVWDIKTRTVAHRYANHLTDPMQRKRFADIYNSLHRVFNVS